MTNIASKPSAFRTPAHFGTQSFAELAAVENPSANPALVVLFDALHKVQGINHSSIDMASYIPKLTSSLSEMEIAKMLRLYFVMEAFPDALECSNREVDIWDNLFEVSIADNIETAHEDAMAIHAEINSRLSYSLLMWRNALKEVQKLSGAKGKDAEVELAEAWAAFYAVKPVAEAWVKLEDPTRSFKLLYAENEQSSADVLMHAVRGIAAVLRCYPELFEAAVQELVEGFNH